jgi:hypothetical protein
MTGGVSVERVVHFIDRSVPLPGIVHSMSLSSLAASLPVDGRQSATALAVARGTTRLLHSLGLCVISELPLPSGRRADLVALGADGTLWIIEIKSSVEDFRADEKWMDYRLHCDRLFFATTTEVPCEIFPKDTGRIVADAFGGAIVCEAPEHRVHAATRRIMTLAFARAAALRLAALADPQGPSGAEV